MNIGIIVCSHTGNTLSVAAKLKENLATHGHMVTLEKIEDDTLSKINTSLINSWDAVIFCSYVQGGAPAVPMKSYLEGVPSLQGKRVACLVTGAFPSCIGRKQTINYIKQACELKGAKICGIGSVGWWSFNRSRQISEVVNHLTNCFK